LVFRERFAFALRRHFHFFDQPRHKIRQWTLATLTRQDIRTVFPGRQRGLAGVQAIFAFWLFTPVTFQARTLENRIDLFFEITGLATVAGSFAASSTRSAAHAAEVVASTNDATM